MAELRETQLRLVYSLLKPVVRMAARFHVPMRSLSELLRLAYFEHLQRQGLSQAEIGRRLGQTDRHMRSLAQRFRSDFFSAEREVGVVREVEDIIAAQRPLRAQLPTLLPHLSSSAIDAALDTLLHEQRVLEHADGVLETSRRYVLLTSQQFHHRIDALNHFLDAMERAVVHRLVYDEREGTMIKTIAFSAKPDALRAFIERLEADLRQRVSALEEEALFSGAHNERYSLGMLLSPFSLSK